MLVDGMTMTTTVCGFEFTDDVLASDDHVIESASILAGMCGDERFAAWLDSVLYMPYSDETSAGVAVICRAYLAANL